MIKQYRHIGITRDSDGVPTSILIEEDKTKTANNKLKMILASMRELKELADSVLKEYEDYEEDSDSLRD